MYIIERYILTKVINLFFKKLNGFNVKKLLIISCHYYYQYSNLSQIDNFFFLQMVYHWCQFLVLFLLIYYQHISKSIPLVLPQIFYNNYQFLLFHQLYLKHHDLNQVN
jgi:hypothetical protein